MSFIGELIEWYLENKRELPWRNTKDPYKIWLSEIILQQTRVDQGLPYYQRFAERYPEVSDFAKASEDEILKLWQGLGYYSRGRNMHKTAQLVMEDHAGYFPTKYDELIKLKGIGEYTAAAISSFSADEPKAVVDGNVFRVLARYYNLAEPINAPRAKKLFTQVANETIDRARPALSNQAMMEFGALHCRPRNPLCETCPVRPGCLAYSGGLVNALPVKLPKQASKKRFFNYVLLLESNSILLHKRGANDIWQNLYELPLIETDTMLAAEEVMGLPQFKEIFGPAILTQEWPATKHVLSHQVIHTNFLKIQARPLPEKLMDNDLFFTDLEELDKLAQPKLIFAFLKKILT